jgi:hypothetical protein
MGIGSKVLALATLMVAGAAGAHSGKEEPLQLTDKSFMQLQAVEMASKDKPNELERVFGLKSYERGNPEDAAEHFRTAARYADKYSQHYLSLMYWHGAGVRVDRVQAYVWADLAAERGSRKLLLIREKMWSQLTAEQQEQALAIGEEYYARYGDEVAKPRAESVMRAFTRGMTGSRLGYRNQRLDVTGQPVSGAFGYKNGGNASSYLVAGNASSDQLYGTIGGLQFDGYWKQQDDLLDRTGSTSVGPLTPVKTSK